MKRFTEVEIKERRRQSTQRYRAADPQRSQAQWRKYRSKKLLEATGGREKPVACEVCGRGGKICFDHSHAHGRFRGWLCNHCNLALGHVADAPEILRKLAAYLETSLAAEAKPDA